MHKTRLWTLNCCVLLTLFMVMAGCASAAGTEQNSQPAASAGLEQSHQAAALEAALSEIEGDVSIRLPGEDNFTTPAGDGLAISSRLKSGSDGSARLDLSNGTIVRMDTETQLSLETQEEGSDGWHAALSLDYGKIWIILKGGRLEVDMPGSSAQVSGSYMSVDYDKESGEVHITCLEGICSLQNSEGSVELTGGQTAVIQGVSSPPESGQMSDADVQEWLAKNPEASIIVQEMSQSSDEDNEEGDGSAGDESGDDADVQADVSSNTAPVDFTYGPEMDNFPQGINPLTCEAVKDEALLDLPAVLMSVTDYPPKVRPQSGMSYASQVYEIYIGEGMTRFLASWYARELEEKASTSGDQPVNNGVFVKHGVVLGDRVWFDLNMNGIQDDDEAGVGGVAVELLDGASGSVLESTTTNSGGYFAFNTEDGKKYRLHVLLPPAFAFSPQDAAQDDNADSDIDAASGETAAIEIGGDDQHHWDAGLYRLSQLSIQTGENRQGNILGDWVWVDINKNGIQDAGEYGASGVEVVLMDKKFNVLQTATTDFSGLYQLDVEAGEYVVRYNLPGVFSEYSFSQQFAGEDREADSDVNAKGWTDIIEITGDSTGLDVGLIPAPVRPVGPARSGRQAFTPVVNSFGPDSCLIAASKDPTVQVSLCRYVYGSPDDVATAGVKPSDILRIASDSKQFERSPNYAGNVCSTVVPQGGKAASEMLVFFSQKNQSIYRFDDLLNKYIRFDDREAEGLGNFVASTDRLTGEQLAYGNVVILVVPHIVDRRFVFSLDMTGQKGRAIVLRNGLLYDEDIIWTTVGEEYEKEEMLRRPVKLRYKDGAPFPLAPGNTWFIISDTQYDLWEPGEPGVWKYRYYPPSGVG